MIIRTNISKLFISSYHECTIGDVNKEYRDLHNEKSPESWKDLFFFEMFKTGKIHVVPAVSVCISFDHKKGELFTCPIGEFKHTGESNDLITEILQGRRQFPVVSSNATLY